MTATEFYKAGKLTDAVAAGFEEVKKSPTDTAKRGFLAELLCFIGDFDRADKQLEIILQQQPELAVGLGILRHVVRGEIVRQQCIKEGRLPEFLGEPTPALKLHLEAAICLREGKLAEATELLEKVEDQRPKCKGLCNGKPFDDFRDLDDSTAAFLEVLTNNGKYYWIPFENVESLDFSPPERSRDLIWRRAAITVTDGPDGEVFIPAIYPATLTSTDDALRLGRATDWQGTEQGPILGVGQRMYLVGSEDQSIMEIKTLSFER